MERAERLPIPHVEFKDTTFAEALEILRLEARANDPKHQGIPIEVDPAVQPWEMISSKTDRPPPGGWPIWDPMKRKITLSLRNTTLAEALHSLTNYACCRFTLSEPYVLGANMDMIDLSNEGKLVSTGPAIDSRECLGAVVSNGRIFYMSQASGFIVSQTYGEESKKLPAVWERP